MNLEQRLVGREGELEFLRFLARRRDTFALRDVSDDTNYFNDDIDIIWYTTMKGNRLFGKAELRSQNYLATGDGLVNYLLGKEIPENARRVAVEVKTDTSHLMRNFRTPLCFVIQVVYDISTGMPGWIYRTKADRLVVFDSGTRRFFTFDVNVFRDYVSELHQKVARDGSFSGINLVDINQRRDNGTSYVNKCLYIPKRLVDEEVGNGLELDYSAIQL